MDSSIEVPFIGQVPLWLILVLGGIVLFLAYRRFGGVGEAEKPAEPVKEEGKKEGGDEAKAPAPLISIPIHRHHLRWLIGGATFLILCSCGSLVIWYNAQPLAQEIRVSARQGYNGPAILKTNGDAANWSSCWGTGLNPDGSGGANPVPVCTRTPTQVPPTKTPVPTRTLNAAQKVAQMKTEAAATKTVAVAETDAAILVYGTPTPVPPTQVPTNTDVPTKTPVPPTPTKVPTKVPPKPCQGTYLASDGSEIQYNLALGQTWTDLKLLQDGTKVRGMCTDEGMFDHEEIPPILIAVNNAGKQAQTVAPVVGMGLVILIGTIVSVFVLYLLRKKVPNIIEFPLYAELAGYGISSYFGIGELLMPIAHAAAALLALWQLWEHFGVHKVGKSVGKYAHRKADELDQRLNPPPPPGP